MRTLLFAGLVLLSLAGAAQGKDEQQIKEILANQSAAWNRGDIEGFMQTYWNSDSLMFIGKNGVKYGWQVRWIITKRATLIKQQWENCRSTYSLSKNFQGIIITWWVSGC